VHPQPGPIARLVLTVIDFVRPPVVLEGDAWLCRWEHPPVLFVGGGSPSYDDEPQHVDVRIDLWNRSPQLVTVIGIKSAIINGERLVESDLSRFDDVTLEPGGARERRSFALAHGRRPRQRSTGGTLKLELRLTRGGAFLGAPRRRFKLAGSPPA
jgi:hypothetical protein